MKTPVDTGTACTLGAPNSSYHALPSYIVAFQLHISCVFPLCHACLQPPHTAVLGHGLTADKHVFSPHLTAGAGITPIKKRRVIGRARVCSSTQRVDGSAVADGAVDAVDAADVVGSVDARVENCRD